MGKQHIQKYRTRFHADAIYSRAIRASGDFVFFQGQTGMDFEGNLVGPGDPGLQADQACRNITQLIEEAGGPRAHVALPLSR